MVAEAPHPFSVVHTRRGVERRPSSLVIRTKISPLSVSTHVYLTHFDDGCHRGKPSFVRLLSLSLSLSFCLICPSLPTMLSFRPTLMRFAPVARTLFLRGATPPVAGRLCHVVKVQPLGAAAASAMFVSPRLTSSSVNNGCLHRAFEVVIGFNSSRHLALSSPRMGPSGATGRDAAPPPTAGGDDPFDGDDDWLLDFLDEGEFGSETDPLGPEGNFIPDFEKDTLSKEKLVTARSDKNEK